MPHASALSLLALASLLFLPTEAHSASLPPPSPPADDAAMVVVHPSPWLWGSAAVFFVALYVLLAFASWPMVRYRTGLPLLFLVLIIVFPPSFMVLLFYALLLRVGLLSAVWIAAASAPPPPPPSAPAGVSMARTPARSSAPPTRAEVARRV